MHCSDELVVFNRLTGPPESLPPDQAALRTWLGRMAARSGTPMVYPKEIETMGVPGNYEEVTVYFRPVPGK